MEKKRIDDIPDPESMGLITGVELFSALLVDDLAFVASKTEVRSVPAGTVVFSEGERAVQFFVVKSGSVSVVSGESGDNPVELARYAPGDVFGDFHFVINGTYDATARTLENTELVVFPKGGSTFDRLTAEKPDTASRILLRSMTMIAKRIRSTNRLISENTPWIRELRRQIYTDPPTGLWNKAFLDTEIKQKLTGTVAVLMLKPDRFKEINDTLGHAAGDEILLNLAGALMREASARNSGWAVRLRSNEMALILSDCDRAYAQDFAESLQASLPSLVSSVPGEAAFPFSASMALGFWPDDCENWSALTEGTNALVQEVWKAGGNRIARFGETVA